MHLRWYAEPHLDALGRTPLGDDVPAAMWGVPLTCPRHSLGRRTGALKMTLAVGVFAVTWAVLSAGLVRASTDYVDLLGDNTYHTSVLFSKAGFAPGVRGVIVANGDDYMSATCSAVLAAVYDGPVLLTPADSLDPRVEDEIWRLGPDRIFVVGTEPSVVRSIAARFPELAAAGGIIMLCGADGRETARLVAEAVAAQAGDAGGVVLVSEDRGVAPPACAVSASALAAGKSWPLLFVPSSGALPEAAARVLSDIAPAVVVQVQTSVDVGTRATIVKLGGWNRYEVGAKVAEYASTVGLGYGHTVALVGSEESSGQGLSAGAYLARSHGMVVLCGLQAMPAETIDVLLQRAGEIRRLDFCGPQKVVCQRVEALVEAKGSLPQGFGTATLTRGTNGSAVSWLEQRLTDLSYRPGTIDGEFDARTRQALIAFQKWEGLKRDGVAGPEVWWRLLVASRPVPKMGVDGTWIEVDKKKQLLFYCVDGQVERTLAVSTGSPAVGIATPSGVFRIVRENTYERLRYKPLYLRRATVLAIHGYKSVPTYPASHGCVRMTWADMDEFHALATVGTAVYIY
jgi:N-acetylmuramoyl-L-alanine amidase